MSLKYPTVACLLFFSLSPVAPVCADAALEQQRQHYRDAKLALKKGQTKRFAALLDSLQDYPLRPYLLYDYHRSRLWMADEAELARFLEQHGDLPDADRLRSRWLAHLAKTGQWQTFLKHYTPQQDKTLRCYQLLARIKTHQSERLLEDIRALWLHGESLPPQCDPSFRLLYNSELMDDGELAWERVRLAMANGNTSLARYLGRWLRAEQRALLPDWIAMHGNPSRGLARPDWPDTSWHRDILLHGMQRLIGQRLFEAVRRWQTLRVRHRFTDAARQRTNRQLAVRAARKRHPDAVALLDRIPAAVVDDMLTHWRLRMALKEQDWALLRRWTATPPEDQSLALRVRYWQARALDQTGDGESAQALYAALARERDYYGFLAADRLGQPYRMNHHPLPPDVTESARTGNLPGLRRAYELRLMEERHRSIREWNHTIERLPQRTARRAAALAMQWGWHHLAIATLARVKAWDDLLIRFPLLHRELLLQHAERNSLDPSWVFALVRAESAFVETARSPAGALGLMQVMPRTGALVAEQLGLARFRTQALTEAATNVRIGSAYMRMMLERYEGDVVLATAAYNAGPGRVSAWRRARLRCIDPTIWVEQIPFEETRKYVRRVLFYASVYDWRLGRKGVPLFKRMTTSRGKGQIVLAGCAGQLPGLSPNAHGLNRIQRQDRAPDGGLGSIVHARGAAVADDQATQGAPGHGVSKTKQ